jgi:hypothetical protein
MGGLADKLHDATEIVHPEGFCYGKKGVEVKDDEIETPVAGTPKCRKF